MIDIIFITEQKINADYKEKVAKLSEEINTLRNSKAVKDSVRYISFVTLENLLSNISYNLIFEFILAF